MNRAQFLSAFFIFSEIFLITSTCSLASLSELDSSQKSQVRTAVARGLMNTPARVEAVIVVRHSDQEITWRSERDHWSHELEEKALTTIIKNAQDSGFKVKDENELLSLPNDDYVKALWSSSKPHPVDAEHPMFIIYTSGSTGKPKGVVHPHGGFLSGISYTMKVSFDSIPGEDVMFVVADPGWITGQSYMIAAPLLCRVSSVLLDGSPTSPPDRIAGVISRHRVTVLKAGSTFLRMLMATPDAEAQLARHDLTSLRMGTFCAEPVNEVVQSFAQRHLTSNYINC